MARPPGRAAGRRADGGADSLGRGPPPDRAVGRSRPLAGRWPPAGDRALPARHRLGRGAGRAAGRGRLGPALFPAARRRGQRRPDGRSHGRDGPLSGDDRLAAPARLPRPRRPCRVSGTGPADRRGPGRHSRGPGAGPRARSRARHLRPHHGPDRRSARPPSARLRARARRPRPGRAGGAVRRLSRRSRRSRRGRGGAAGHRRPSRRPVRGCPAGRLAARLPRREPGLAGRGRLGPAGLPGRGGHASGL